MEKEDFSICKFINDEMKYFTYFDFCKNKNIIKKIYDEFDSNQKLFYKWYVYANIHMSSQFKNAIWDFLNGYDENGFELMRLRKFYKAK